MESKNTAHSEVTSVATNYSIFSYANFFCVWAWSRCSLETAKHWRRNP